MSILLKHGLKSFGLSLLRSNAPMVLLSCVLLAPIKGEAKTAVLTLVSAPVSGGTVSPTGATSITTNEAYEITAAPAPGYFFVSWSSSGQNTFFFCGIDMKKTYVSINGDATVTANFAPDTASYKLTLTASPESALKSSSPKINTTVDWSKNDYISIGANPIDGYVFSNWTADPAENVQFADDKSGVTYLSMRGNAKITANFTKSPTVCTISGAVEPAGSGFMFGGAKELDIYQSTWLYSMETKPGYRFSHFTAEPEGNAVFQWAECGISSYVKVLGSLTITAHFTQTVPKTCKVLIYGSGGNDENSGTFSPMGWQEVQVGSKINLSAKPENGYVFDEWGFASIFPDDCYSSTTDVTASQNGMIFASFYFAGEKHMTLSKGGKLSVAHKESLKRDDFVMSDSFSSSLSFTLPADFDYSAISAGSYIELSISGFDASFTLSDDPKAKIDAVKGKGNATFKIKSKTDNLTMKIAWEKKKSILKVTIQDKNSEYFSPLGDALYNAPVGYISETSTNSAYAIFDGTYWQGNIRYSGRKKLKVDKNTEDELYSYTVKGVYQ